MMWLFRERAPWGGPFNRAPIMKENPPHPPHIPAPPINSVVQVETEATKSGNSDGDAKDGNTKTIEGRAARPSRWGINE